MKLILLQNFCYVFWFPPSYQTKFSRVNTTSKPINKSKEGKASLEGKFCQIEGKPPPSFWAQILTFGRPKCPRISHRILPLFWSFQSFPLIQSPNLATILLRLCRMEVQIIPPPFFQVFPIRSKSKYLWASAINLPHRLWRKLRQINGKISVSSQTSRP